MSDCRPECFGDLHITGCPKAGVCDAVREDAEEHRQEKHLEFCTSPQHPDEYYNDALFHELLDDENYVVGLCCVECDWLAHDWRLVGWSEAREKLTTDQTP